MADDDDTDRWVAHRQEGWTVETEHAHDPLSVHDTFDDALSALGERRHDDSSPTEPEQPIVEEHSSEPKDV